MTDYGDIRKVYVSTFIIYVSVIYLEYIHVLYLCVCTMIDEFTSPGKRKKEKEEEEEEMPVLSIKRKKLKSIITSDGAITIAAEESQIPNTKGLHPSS